MAELAATLVATEDDRLNQAEALVRSYCRWHIAPSQPKTYTVTVPSSYWAAAPCVRTLVLPSLHVTAVDSITADGVAVDPADYTWAPNGTIQGSWSAREVVVVFTHGYENPPADVTAVVQAVAQRAVNNPGSLVRTQDGPFSDTYSQTGFNQSIPMALLDAEKSILNPYRLPSLA